MEKATSGRSRRAVDLQGLPKAPAERIALIDCDFRGVSEPSIVEDIRGLELRNVRVNGRVVRNLAEAV